MIHTIIISGGIYYSLFFEESPYHMHATLALCLVFITSV